MGKKKSRPAPVGTTGFTGKCRFVGRERFFQRDVGGLGRVVAIEEERCAFCSFCPGSNP